MNTINKKNTFDVVQVKEMTEKLDSMMNDILSARILKRNSDRDNNFLNKKVKEAHSQIENLLKNCGDHICYNEDFEELCKKVTEILSQLENNLFSKKCLRDHFNTWKKKINKLRQEIRDAYYLPSRPNQEEEIAEGEFKEIADQQEVCEEINELQEKAQEFSDAFLGSLNIFIDDFVKACKRRFEFDKKVSVADVRLVVSVLTQFEKALTETILGALEQNTFNVGDFSEALKTSLNNKSQSLTDFERDVFGVFSKKVLTEAIVLLNGAESFDDFIEVSKGEEKISFDEEAVRRMLQPEKAELIDKDAVIDIFQCEQDFIMDQILASSKIKNKDKNFYAHLAEQLNNEFHGGLSMRDADTVEILWRNIFEENERKAKTTRQALEACVSSINTEDRPSSSAEVVHLGNEVLDGSEEALLKVIQAASEDLRQKVIAEAEAMAALRLPNTEKIKDLGEKGDSLLKAMNACKENLLMVLQTLEHSRKEIFDLIKRDEANAISYKEVADVAKQLETFLSWYNTYAEQKEIFERIQKDYQALKSHLISIEDNIKKGDTFFEKTLPGDLRGIDIGAYFADRPELLEKDSNVAQVVMQTRKSIEAVRESIKDVKAADRDSSVLEWKDKVAKMCEGMSVVIAGLTGGKGLNLDPRTTDLPCQDPYRLYTAREIIVTDLEGDDLVQWVSGLYEQVKTQDKWKEGYAHEVLQRSFCANQEKKTQQIVRPLRKFIKYFFIERALGTNLLGFMRRCEEKGVSQAFVAKEITKKMTTMDAEQLAVVLVEALLESFRVFSEINTDKTRVIGNICAAINGATSNFTTEKFIKGILNYPTIHSAIANITSKEEMFSFSTRSENSSKVSSDLYEDEDIRMKLVNIFDAVLAQFSRNV